MEGQSLMDWSTSSWKNDIDQILPNLYISSVFAAESLEKLQEFKITHILIVAKGLEPVHSDKFTYKQISIDDNYSENI